MATETYLPGEALPTREDILAGIPIVEYIDRYHVKDPYTIEALRKFPTLCYLLGDSESRVVQTEDGPIEADVLTEGSGMFGIKRPETALTWSGIFDHGLGVTERGVWLINRIKVSSPEQRAQFAEAGIDLSELDQLTDALVEDFGVICHGSRRAHDERDRFRLHDRVHPDGMPGPIMQGMLQEQRAPAIFAADNTGLIRVEINAETLPTAEKDGLVYFSRGFDAAWTYADWTFGRVPMPLTQRFPQLVAERPDHEPGVLDTLAHCGQGFETVANEILGTDIYREMLDIGPFEWATELRRAYCAPSGVAFYDAFKPYVDRFAPLF